MNIKRRWAIDGSAVGSNRGGDETYVRGVIDGLVATAESDEAIAVFTRTGNVVPGDIGATTVGVPTRGGAMFYGRDYGRALRATRWDAALSMTHAPLKSSTPVALAVLDLSFEHLPDAYPPFTKLRLRSMIRHQVRRAPVVVTISEFSRSDIMQTYGVDGSKIFVVPGAVTAPIRLSDAEQLAAVAWREQAGIRGPYVLYLGNLHPRKNVATAIRAYARAGLGGMQFVIAGARWWGDDERAAIASIPDARVILTGRVTDVQRESLLRDASVLVYPSRFEGFGLPPLEAMRRGVPVVAADSTAIPETVADAALLVDPSDDEGMATALNRAVSDPSLRERLIAAGHRRADHFSVERAGKAMRAALVAAACDPGRRQPATSKANS